MKQAKAEDLTAAIKRQARSLGFDLVGITTAEPFPVAQRALIERIERGRLRGLDWLTVEWARQAGDPRRHFPDAQSLISVGLSYGADDPPLDRGDDRPRGLVARYARGSDYHAVVGDRLRSLGEGLLAVGASRVKPFVDTGRLIERAVAGRAGLGWPGKNTCLLTERFGSWVFLGEILTDLAPRPDGPLDADCGECDRCLQACPTGALVAPGVLESARCVSFLTVELRGSIPEDLRPLIGSRIIGCDACQNVCPINQQAERSSHPEFSAGALGARPELLPLLRLTSRQFRERFRRTPVWRAKRAGLLRNVAVALGNLRHPDAVPGLADALADPDPLVRGHVAWALGEIGGRPARSALAGALRGEADVTVRSEMARAVERV